LTKKLRVENLVTLSLLESTVMLSCMCLDFVVVQSAWGMTQGCVMPFSGFIIRAIGEKVRHLLTEHHREHRHGNTSSL
jgi:NADH:ubiquinone oxidoreductase subunit K